MEAAQQRIQQVVQQALLSALGDIPDMQATRQQVVELAPPGEALNSSVPFVSAPDPTEDFAEDDETIPGPQSLHDPSYAPRTL
eukprot:10654760-Prorocentrum_lima.AAC.1